MLEVKDNPSRNKAQESKMNIQIATAPVSWGVVMKDTPNVPPWEQVLDEIAAAGYSGTELGPVGYLPLDPERVKDELAQRNLTLLSAFVPVNFVDPQAEPDVYEEALMVMKMLHALECRTVVLSDSLFWRAARTARAGRIQPEDSLAGETLIRFARNVEQVAHMAHEEYGLRAVAHPHVGGHLEAPWEIDALLAQTDPDLVGLCLDTAHIIYGGGDPVAMLDRWRDRVWYLHIKECSLPVLDEVRARAGDYFDGVRSGVFPELGQGSVDWLALRDLLEEIDFQGWGVVEQDILPESGIDALASAKRNRAFLHEQLGW
jgi:inosose dehydratase